MFSYHTLSHIKKFLTSPLTLAYFLIIVITFFVIDNIYISIIMGCIALTTHIGTYIHAIQSEKNLIEEDLLEPIEPKNAFTSIISENQPTIGNYRFNVKLFVERFNNAKTQDDWNGVAEVGSKIVSIIEKLKFQNYQGGILFHSALEIVTLVAFLKAFLAGRYTLGSDLRKMGKIELDEFNGNVIGIKRPLTTLIQIEARDIRREDKNKFTQSHKIHLFCQKRAYQKRLGRVA